MREKQRLLTERNRDNEQWRAARRASSAKWKAAHPEHVDYHNRYHLARKYGLSVGDKERMISAQGGKCAICKSTMRRPHIDHCHKTGAIRKVLCDKCNRGLGQFRDDVVLIQEAEAYLTFHNPEPSWQSSGHVAWPM